MEHEIFDFYPPALLERRKPGRKKDSLSYWQKLQQVQVNDHFTCTCCRAFVTCSLFLSGVHNRNHCPYCLWSRHLDLWSAGDRLAACKAPMKPIGLTLKKAHKKYAAHQAGELMVAHRCVDCGGITINRLAADDDTARLLDIFTQSMSLDEKTRSELLQQDIRLLKKSEARLVHTRLFGKN